MAQKDMYLPLNFNVGPKDCEFVNYFCAIIIVFY